MSHRSLLAALAVASALCAPAALRAQGPNWRPPSQVMPQMPSRAELRSDWLGPRASWFQGVESVSGATLDSLTPIGEGRPGSDVAQMVRFTSGPFPVVVWSDRNADGRADMIEIYKSGGMIIQLIDANFDTRADVMRVYDSAGKLLRQERM